MSVKHGCLCIDEKNAIPNAIKDAVLEDIHSTHTGGFAMLFLAQLFGGHISSKLFWLKIASAKPARKLIRF